MGKLVPMLFAAACESLGFTFEPPLCPVLLVTAAL